MTKQLLSFTAGAALTAAALTISHAEPGLPRQLPPAADKAGVTFAADIKPIFEHSCVRCHAAGQAKARLRLDSLENALKGSEDGKVIKPGDSAGSRLVHNVAGVGRAKRMPPPRNKANIGPLTSQQISLIRAWIDQGAK